MPAAAATVREMYVCDCVVCDVTLKSSKTKLPLPLIILLKNGSNFAYTVLIYGQNRMTKLLKISDCLGKKVYMYLTK